ncbi:uncharacterized protein LOC143151420 [Ptiloglossa arizonensis]|uniref:uncharacterized protein LOC143151420 n=1 Tax=Ptiloglossa arizonensis TaxID=3350558 RepID=UPI003F9F739C
MERGGYEPPKHPRRTVGVAIPASLSFLGRIAALSLRPSSPASLSRSTLPKRDPLPPPRWLRSTNRRFLVAHEPRHRQRAHGPSDSLVAARPHSQQSRPDVIGRPSNGHVAGSDHCENDYHDDNDDTFHVRGKYQRARRLPNIVTDPPIGQPQRPISRCRSPTADPWCTIAWLRRDQSLCVTQASRRRTHTEIGRCSSSNVTVTGVPKDPSAPRFLRHSVGHHCQSAEQTVRSSGRCPGTYMQGCRRRRRCWRRKGCQWRGEQRRWKI